MDPKIAKVLLLLLIRGSKPVYLTAGKVFPMTMATFCGVKYFNIYNFNYCILKHLIFTYNKILLTVIYIS